MQKQTKLWMRVLSLTLVVLMLGSMLLACKKKDETSAETTGGGDVVTSGDESKSVLDGVRYNGEKIYVYGWISDNITELVTEFSSDLGVVEQNIYKRLDETKKQLNIEVDWKEVPGSGSHPGFIQDTVIANQTGAYDVICSYSQWAAALTSQGVSKNLLKFNTLDFDHPAWPADMVDQLTMFNKLYFCTGDISTNLIFMTSLVGVNLDMVSTWKINEKIQEKYGEANIYDLVRKGKWTYDAMFTLADGIWQNTDGVAGRTEGDTYGFVTTSGLICNFYAGAGYTIVEADENGLYLSEDYTDVDSIEKLLKDVIDPLFDSGYCYYGTSNFAQGLNLFSLSPASTVYLKWYHADGLNYSAVPVPKYDAAQDGYHSYHSHPYSNFIVTTGSLHKEIGASFIQCLAEWSYDTTRIAIFENTMRARFSNGDPDIIEMWEMIVDSQTFDLSRIFRRELRRGGTGAYLADQFIEKLKAERTDWANFVQSYEGELKDLLTGINTTLQTLPD